MNKENNLDTKNMTMLMILDGYGLGSHNDSNAIYLANTPNLDEIFKNNPLTELSASGEAVGLPAGQMGNSEVGHLNIGAGRIVYQELTRISLAIDDESFFKNKILIDNMKSAIEQSKALHIMGLLSDGGVHSHIDHLKALIKMAKEQKVQTLYIHGFLDGRDVSPTSGLKYIDEIENYIKEIGLGKLVTLSGRYYAMDRDNRFDRVKKAYEAICQNQGRFAPSGKEAIKIAYQNGEDDEFLTPTTLDKNYPGVSNGDSIIMYNFRPDRAREITRAFVDPAFSGFKREKTVKVKYTTMTMYDAKMPEVTVAYPPEELSNTLGEYISDMGLRQLRIAETEKYAHVTFFFNGGKEKELPGETRILIPSPKVSTYDLAPQMSALEVTDTVIKEIEKNKYDLIILNFANADMVGHTGNIKAAISAIETLDRCVPKIVNACLKNKGNLFITADHGNADIMKDEKGKPITAHSLNPVPLCYIGNRKARFIKKGKLSDIAPTLLRSMDLKIPKEMTGENLIVFED